MVQLHHESPHHMSYLHCDYMSNRLKTLGVIKLLYEFLAKQFDQNWSVYQSPTLYIIITIARISWPTLYWLPTTSTIYVLPLC